MACPVGANEKLEERAGVLVADAGVDTGAPNENAGTVIGLRASVVVVGISLRTAEGANAGRPPKSEGGAVVFCSSLHSATGAGEGAGGTTETPGLENADEFAKKLGMDVGMELAAGAASAAGFAGAGLGGMSEIDGTEGTGGAVLAGVAGTGSEALGAGVSVVVCFSSGADGGVVDG